MTAACYAPNDGQVEPPLVLAAGRAVLEEAGARMLPGRAGSLLDDDGVRVEVSGEVLRPGPASWPRGPRRCGWPPTPAWRSRRCPARACWSRPGRCRRSPTGWSTCPAAPGRRCTCVAKADGSVLIGERTQETVAGDPGMHHARALLAQAVLPVLAGVPVDRFGGWPAGPCPPTGCRSSAPCRGWTRSTWRSATAASP